MALVRCNEHGNPKGRNQNEYVIGVKPVGYPETALVCGRPGCEHPGLAWLTRQEYDAYRDGQRVFEFPTHAFKIRVE